MEDEESNWTTHAARLRQEITAAQESADSLERILPNLSDDETKRKVELVTQSYRLHANRLSEHIRDEPPMTSECSECARLAKEVESALGKIASLTQAQREAFRQNKYAEFVRLDKELETALGRASGFCQPASLTFRNLAASNKYTLRRGLIAHAR